MCKNNKKLEVLICRQRRILKASKQQLFEITRVLTPIHSIQCSNTLTFSLVKPEKNSKTNLQQAVFSICLNLALAVN